jgi:hypothetical protein
MATEVWFRNPDNYIRELVEVGEYKIAWDRGLLVKKRIDPVKHASLYFGKTFDYRVLLVGEQGTAELRPGDTFDKPSAVYPTWVYGEEASLLEELMAKPVGEDMTSCMDTSVAGDERPVWGQEHRVVITEIPNATSGPGRKFLRYLKELQEDYPKAIIHVHGLYGWKVAFGMGFGAADVEPRTAAQKGKVHLPSGKEEKYEHVQANVKWVTALGFKPVDLAVPRMRCMYNIKSAVWAGQHYAELFNFRVNGGGAPVDHESSTADFTPVTAGTVLPAKAKAESGDRFLCDTCSLQNDCKYFRAGAVCSVPGAEPTPLARYFNSRDANLIIDGLGTLMAANAHRLERGLRIEEIDGDMSGDVTKMMGQVFDQGVKLAKLLDPSLAGKTNVQVNVGAGGAATVSAGNPRQLVAEAIRALEAKGIDRADITPQMIGGVLEGMNNPASKEAAVQGQVVASREEEIADMP